MVFSLVEIRISDLFTICDRFNCSRSQFVTLNSYAGKSKSRKRHAGTPNMQNLWSQIVTTKMYVKDLTILENLKVLGYEH